MIKINRVLYKLLAYISLIIFIILLISRLFISANFSVYHSNIHYCELYYFFNFYTIISIAFFLFCLYKNNYFYNKTRFVMILVFIIPVFIGLLAMIIYPYTLTSDAYNCFYLAKAFVDGSTLQECLKLRENYLTVYPFQYGIISIWKIIIDIFNSENAVRIYQIIQILLTGISNIFLYKIFLLFKKDQESALSFILLSFLWIVPYLLSPYTYSFGTGLTFSIISLYFFIKFSLKQNKLYFIISVITILVAVYIKINYSIVLIAYLIYILFFDKYILLKKFILASIIMFLLLFSMNSSKIISRIIEGETLPSGVPMAAWLVIGSPSDISFYERINVGTNPGYYNAYNWNLAIQTNYDSEEMNKIAKKDLQHVITNVIDNPKNTVKFYFYKIISTWNSRDFMASLYMAGEGIFDNHEKYIEDLDSGITGIIIDQITNIATTFIFLGSIFFFKNKKENPLIIVILWFLGGFFYHLIFETKAIYVYLYITILVPVAALGINNFLEIIKSEYSRKFNGTRYIIITMACLLIISFIYNTQKFYGAVYESYADVPMKITMSREEMHLKQELKVDNDCITNGIEINYSGSINDDILYYTLSCDGEILRSGIIKQEDFDIKNQWVSVKFENLKLKKNINYEIELVKRGNSANNFDLIYGFSEWANGRFVSINGSVMEGYVLNVKLIGVEISDFYYYQNKKIELINEKI